MNLNDFTRIDVILNFTRQDWNAFNVYDLNNNQEQLENNCLSGF